MNVNKSATEILSSLLEEAYISNASDIHFDAQKYGVLVRMRVNGSIQERSILNEDKYQEILSKLKIHSNLQIDDHQTAKDGSFKMKMGDESVSFRLSIITNRFGEQAVIRLLSKNIELNLDNLGFEKEDQELILFSLSKPGSIGIVMGPTGSGKTTTLYSILNEIKKADQIAVTIEDPVECWINGIRQIETSDQNGLTFSRALRSVLRQDPDIIFIGEIRDYDSALLAFQAALTGHIVLTSIHASGLSELVPRLLALGLPNYLIEDIKIVSINQRLIQTLCENCKNINKISSYELAKSFNLLELESSKFSSVTFYESLGCTKCKNSGIGGRAIIYEIGGERKKIKDRIIDFLLSSKISYKNALNNLS
jgi:type IV pilus assembly protein PilB